MAAGEIIRKNNQISIECAHSVSDTIDHLEAVLKDKGLGIFGRVDHAANARKVDLDMPETQVLIFGNPKLGTKLMLASPSIALDLPLKMMATESTDGKVYVSWTDPMHLKHFHQVENCDDAFATISEMLMGVATAAAISS